eukprot:CAMPEP_0201551170 /NCGR_PEP_ID=MMETSP0173_2-20130828/7393_1 /ASSEMBLY_ACC=CAM_ASM_000268 /TAXON_ID=218659 /ORGANISM="Vexillifera sp., Strain DIVA3 564/2" /LENGTH=140 /DNA_ID=CAMNT_0047961359 /DNA_START=77 /DNA_END=499 /DNA_ORIENTATION=+
MSSTSGSNEVTSQTSETNENTSTASSSTSSLADKNKHTSSSENSESQDLSWDTDDNGSSHVEISAVTESITPAERYRRLFGLPAGPEDDDHKDNKEDVPDSGVSIFDYLFADPGDGQMEISPDPQTKPAGSGNDGCCNIM